MDFLKPKAPAPEMKSASDGLLVWIDCEVSPPGSLVTNGNLH